MADAAQQHRVGGIHRDSWMADAAQQHKVGGIHRDSWMADAAQQILHVQHIYVYKILRARENKIKPARWPRAAMWGNLGSS